LRTTRASRPISRKKHDESWEYYIGTRAIYATRQRAVNPDRRDLLIVEAAQLQFDWDFVSTRRDLMAESHCGRTRAIQITAAVRTGRRY
jgi:hypothetical protein